MNRTVDEIDRAIRNGDALVLTAREVEDLMDQGREEEVREVDVVTTGTMGIMSGTYAVLSFQMTEAGIHKKFVKASINGVPAMVGPCPNESLGIIDVMVWAQWRARNDRTRAAASCSGTWWKGRRSPWRPPPIRVMWSRPGSASMTCPPPSS